MGIKPSLRTLLNQALDPLSKFITNKTKPLFLEGEFEVEIDDQFYQMKAGDVAFIPEGLPHSWKNIGDSIGKILYISSSALNIAIRFQDLHNLNARAKFN